MIIKEFDFIYNKKESEFFKNSISNSDFENLKRFALENEQILKLTSKNNREVLQTQNFVGVIQLKSGLTIEILPKIANLKNSIDKTKKILIKMLRTLRNSPFKTFQFANLKTEKLPLIEIFIQMFLHELSLLIKKGIKSDYINLEKNQNFLKGKLKLKEQLKYNVIHKERFFVSYDEYLPNRMENRLIKTTLKKIYKLSCSVTSKQLIRTFLFVFDEITPVFNYRNIFKQLKIDRTMKYYETTLLWCKTFLLEESFTPYSGKEIAFALLFDMNKLFEDFVGNWLIKNINCPIKLQDSKYWLTDEPKKFRLIPDIVLNNGKIIMDTKWKLLDKEKNNQKISQSDLYQMFAYASKYKDCEKVYLIYPFVENVNLSEYKTKICDNREVSILPIFFDLEKNRLTYKVSY